MNTNRLSKPLSTALNSQMTKEANASQIAMSLMDKMKIAGGEKVSSSALYSLDKDIEKNLM